MNDTELELQFQKFNLQKDDALVIKINSEGLTSEQLSDKLKEVSEDEFVKYVREKGNAVVITYTGIDFQILRLQGNDKLAVYVNLDLVEENEREDYMKLIETKLVDIKDKYVIIPITNDAIRTRIMPQNEEK